MKEGNVEEEKNKVQKEITKDYNMESMSKERLEKIVEKHIEADKKRR